MDQRDLFRRCCCLLFFFFFFFFVSVCAHGGFSEDPGAHLGEKVPPQRMRRQSKPTKPALKVLDYRVRCLVVSRYAVTTVQSSVWNQLGVLKEAAFEVDLPSSAFISNFSITSDGKVYVAQVKERAAARKIYDAAKKQGKTAGLVATKEREIEKFRVAVGVSPGAQVSFSLTYEELLPRRLGRYELSLGLRPGQAVQNLTVDVAITERSGIGFLKVLPLKTTRLLSNAAKAGDGDEPASTQVERSDGCARVHFSPSVRQQNAVSSKGLDADFVVQYDVDLRDPMGDVQVYDGYFVHHFAPRGLPVVPKDVIFVIDVSGSMIGNKIKQTKQAMGTILADLREGDHFNIITFSDKVHTWRKGRTVRATRQNVRDAKDFVRMIIAEGWTNINAALLSAAQLVNASSASSSAPPGRHSSRRVPLVIFLTDGEATIGVTTGDTILDNARRALGSASLFGLAFGDDADFLLLRRLALDNRGVARMVYEDADAALQLKGFYDEVASPLLSDVQLSYLDEQAFDVTRSLFPNYFQGSELVVAGRVKPGVRDLKVSMSATDSKQHVKLENDVLVSQAADGGCQAGAEGAAKFVRRLWAYYTIKELLLAKLNATDSATQRLLADKATNLSLKYNFVTPVTSLVVVKPDEATPAATTAKPAATVTAATAATKSSVDLGAAKKQSLASNSRPGRTKPEPPQAPPIPAQTKKNPAPPSAPTAKTPSRRTSTTSSPTSPKTAPASLSSKKHHPAPNISKNVAPPISGKISTSLLNALKTVPPPSPGKVSAAQKTTASSAPTTTTTATTTAPPPRSDPAPPAGRTVPPPAGATAASTQRTDNHGSTSAPDVPPAGATTSAAPTLTPTKEDNHAPAGADLDLGVATLLSATFAPMPGVTDGPRLWEAAGLLDVSTSIQIQRKDIDLVKDYDATYDYDYDLSYDAWDDTADTGSFELPSRASDVRVFSSSVDGDPHFVVQLPKLHQNLCFTVDGRADDVLRLLEDPERGIIVDGHLIGAPSKPGADERPRTYFDRLTISTATGLVVTVSLDTVAVEGEGRDVLPAAGQGAVLRQGVAVAVDGSRGCRVEVAPHVRFLVLFHHYNQPSYLQMAHLGFYVADGRGLSASTQGLLGQFQHADVSVTLSPGAAEAKAGALARGTLRWGSQHMPVTLQDKTLKDTERRRHPAPCWVVAKAEVQRLLGHPYEAFVVDRG